ncbi:MAG: hypothetical protein Q9195_007588 [Heterodermia aff. obscurata]
MAEAFHTTINSAVAAITTFKTVPTTATKQSKPDPLGIEQSGAPRSPREPEGSIAPGDSPLAIPRSATVPTSSMEVGLEDIAQQSTQQNFSRRFAHKAPSTNGDLAAGFKFAKHKQPHMNFSRQIPAYEQGIQDPADGTTDSNTPLAPREREPIVVEPTNTADSLTISTSTNTAGSSKNAIAETSVTEPKTVITGSIQEGPELATSQPSPPEEADTAHIVSQPASSLEVTGPQCSLPTTSDTVLEETKNKFKSRSISILTEPFTPKQLDRHIGAPKPQSLNRPIRTPKADVPEKAGSPHVSRSKVTKSRQRRHSNAAPRSGIDLDDLASKTSFTEEDLLQVLLIRYNRDKQEKEQIRADHATEIHVLETLSHTIWDRLKESEQRMVDQESELSKYRTRQPKFASQIKKLRDYVKGLTNDQHGLRDSFVSMQRIHSATCESKQQIDMSLQQVRATASDVDKRAANALKDAGHEIANLARVVQNQKAQLQNDAELIQHERERSQKLELEVAKINASQQQSMHVFAQHANCIVQKMNSMLEKTEELQTIQQPGSLNEINASLGQCLDSLDKLCETQNSKVERLSALDGSMKDLANGIASKLQAYHDDVKSGAADKQNAIVGLREQISNLATSIATEQDLTQQISNHRMKKAETDAKLDAMDKALQEARNQIFSKDDDKRVLEEQFAGLKSEIGTLQSDARESSATAARLTEIKAHYHTIETKLTALKESTEESYQQLQDQFEERANMQLHKEDLETKLKEEYEKARAVADQGRELERNANMRFEAIRIEILAKAEFDQNLLSAEHRLALAEVEGKLVKANEEVQKMTIRLDQQNLEHDNWSISVMEQMKQVREMRSLKEMAEKSMEECLSRIAILTKEQDQLMETEAEKVYYWHMVQWFITLTRTQTSKIQKLETELDRTRKGLEEKEAQLEEKETELKEKKAQLVENEAQFQAKEAQLKKKEEQFEEKETMVATCQRALRLGVEDIDKKDAEIKEKDFEIIERRSEARQAQDTLQAVKVDHEAEICRVKKSYEAEILSLKGEIEVANASVVTLTEDLSRGISTSPSKPRRKADRSATQELKQVVKESQSQGDDDMLDTVSPRQVEFITSTQTSNDGMDYLDLRELDDFDIPPTPQPSSQVFRKTVTFASDHSSVYFDTQRTSPSKTRPSYHGSRVVEDSQDRAAPLKQPSFETPSYRSSTTYSQKQSETFREPTPASSLPRSALKSSNTASKRSTTTAGHADQGGEPKRNRRASTVGPGLRPVLPDTKSPSGGVHRPRRQLGAAKTATGTKAKGTFNQASVRNKN